MTRKKVVLEFIKNDSARKASFKKRNGGLVKKVHEITTLCAIDSCAIIYSPNDTEPVVYPSVLEAQRVISRFSMLSEVEQSMKMVNQEGYTKERISKGEEQIKKLQKENHHQQITIVMYDCLVGEGPSEIKMSDLSRLEWILDQNLKEIRRRMESLTGNTQLRGLEILTRNERSLAMDFIMNSTIQDSSSTNNVIQGYLSTNNPTQGNPSVDNPMQDYLPPMQGYRSMNNPMQGYPYMNDPMLSYPSLNHHLPDYVSTNNPMQGHPSNNPVQDYPWPFPQAGTMLPSFYNRNNDEAGPSSRHP